MRKVGTQHVPDKGLVIVAAILLDELGVYDWWANLVESNFQLK
jgi:hypothetical protein